MLYWIRKASRMAAGCMFFAILISSILVSQSVSMAAFIRWLIYASIGAILSWFIGFVVVDMLLKGLITHIDAADANSLIDGGFVQQVQMLKEEIVPGGKEMPFTEYKGNARSHDGARGMDANNAPAKGRKESKDGAHG